MDRNEKGKDMSSLTLEQIGAPSKAKDRIAQADKDVFRRSSHGFIRKRGGIAVWVDSDGSQLVCNQRRHTEMAIGGRFGSALHDHSTHYPGCLLSGSDGKG
jgi:hypothetical protein